MIRRNGEYREEVRQAMRGGDGEVRIAHFWENGADLQAPTRLCARLTLEPGASIGFHRHENEEEVFVIVQGRAEIDDNGAAVTLGAGDTILTGGGAGHGVRSLGPESLVMVAVIVPFAR